jgi:hypothetical protein
VVDRLHSIAVVGDSMWPLLRSGVRIDVRPIVGCPRLGAILVYAAADRLVVHRLVKYRHESGALMLVTKGDCSGRWDPPIVPMRVLGEVAVVHYRRWALRVDGLVLRRVGWALSRCGPAIHALRAWLRRATPAQPDCRVVAEAGELPKRKRSND